MEEDDERLLAANSELRYIALELMKIAQKSGRSFSEVAGEYMQNVERLATMISGEEMPAKAKSARRASSRDK